MYKNSCWQPTTYIHTYIDTCRRVDIYMYTHADIYVCWNLHISVVWHLHHIGICAHVYWHTYTWIDTYTHYSVKWFWVYCKISGVYTYIHIGNSNHKILDKGCHSNMLQQVVQQILQWCISHVSTSHNNSYI